MNEITGITALVAAVWYWWDSMKAREAARRAGKKACESASLQFLDDTVSRQKIWLKRNPTGRMSLHRLYSFEFTSIGDQRYKGSIAMTGKEIIDIQMDVHHIN